MLKAGSILIFITFIVESIFIFPLFWTIPSFVLYSKVSKEEATEGEKIALSVLGIIFGTLPGILGGIFIIVSLNNNENQTIKQLS